MADKVTIWFDAEADYLEVQFKSAPGHMKETTNDALLERVDADGKVIGLAFLVSADSRKKSHCKPNSPPLDSIQASIIR